MADVDYIPIVAFFLVFLMDLSVVYIIVKERLWRDDNAVLICNLMTAFMFHALWEIFSLSCASASCSLNILPFVLGLQILAHVAVLLTLVFLSYDRFYALKEKTLVKIHSRPFAARRIVCVWLVAIFMACITVVGVVVLNPRNLFFRPYLVCHCTSFLIVMVVILTCFIRVWRLHRQNYKMSVERGTVGDPMWRRTHEASSRLSLTVASLAIGQCITWVPLYAYMIVWQESLFQSEYQNPVFITFLCINFFAAPLLVFVFSEQFRQYFKRQLLCCLYPELQELNWIDDTLRSSVRTHVSARSQEALDQPVMETET